MSPAPALLDVEIESIAAGGDGVGRVEGMVVFAPRTAPGDLARVRARTGKRFARGEMVELLRAGPHRIEPPCPHYVFDRCGGCQVQHLDYDAQLAAKQVVIRDAFTRIARRDVPLPEVRASARPWRYRRKLTLALRRRSGDWVAGLHPYDDPVGVFRLDDCPITDEGVVAVWKELLASRHLLPSDTDALRGAVRLAPEGATFVLEGGTRWTHADAFFDAATSLAALWWRPEQGSRRLVAQRASAPAGASFAQVNTEVAAALRAHAVERVMAHGPATAVDAYAGSGDTAVALAERGVRVTAIELDADAAKLSAGRLPAGSRSLAGRVEQRLPGALPADVVLVNPPRAGMDEQVPPLLDAHREHIRAVVYVSCDPATLARDVARMPGFRIASVLGFDMFPQTAHVETVCELVSDRTT